MRPLGVVLAAGASRRMGRPKALLSLDGAPLVARHVHALGAVCDRVIVVLGADADAIRAAVPAQAEIRLNPDAGSQMIDSLRVALADTDASCAFVTPVDVPPADPRVLRALLAAGAPAVPVAPDGRRGHPALVDGPTLARVREATPADGLRGLLGGAARVPVADPWVALDFDDPASWAAFLATRGAG